MKDEVRARGLVTITYYCGDEVEGQQTVENMVVTSGLEYFANRCSAVPTATVMSHMAMGTGATAPDKSQTALLGEISGGRVALSSAPAQLATQTVYNATFAAGVGTATVRELGIFNATSGGTMLARVVFADQIKESTTSFTVQWLVAFQ